MKARANGAVSWLASAVLLALPACRGPGKAAEDPSAGVAEDGASRTPWKDKSREQRMDWMGLAVFPKMRAVFVEHDAEFSSFDCQTCHGQEMEMVDFKMPNQLFSLPKENTLDWAKDYDANTTQFMLDKVMPEMAALLDMKPYDPQTGKGFGCLGCHPSDSD